MATAAELRETLAVVELEEKIVDLKKRRGSAQRPAELRAAKHELRRARWSARLNRDRRELTELEPRDDADAQAKVAAIRVRIPQAEAYGRRMGWIK